MNDKEYYSLTNRNSSWQLRQKLKKMREQKKIDAKKSKSEILNKINESYNNLEARQGSADAQMLVEKKSK